MEKQVCGCSAVVSIEKAEIQGKWSFQEFLREIQVPFEIIEFVDTTSSPESFEKKDNQTASLTRNPQSLAVCLFLKETSQHKLNQQFLNSPWQLDHVIESPLHVRPQKIARQEFYSFSDDLPLWSVNTVHYGNEHVRLHINARNFPAMTEFYEILTDHKARHCGSNFCFLTICSENELDLQIGLKWCPDVAPIPSKTYRLKFRIQSVSPLFKYLESLKDLKEETNYILEDPDGNEVIVERLYVAEREKSVPQLHENNNGNCHDVNFNTIGETGYRKFLLRENSYLTTAFYRHEECSSLCVDHGRDDNDCCNADVDQNDDGYVTYV